LKKNAQKFALENICAVFLANQIFSSFAFTERDRGLAAFAKEWSK